MIKDTKHNLFKGERKSLTETLEEKGKRLTTRRGCEKRRMATESEESMEKKKNEQINLLESGTKRLATQPRFQRQKIASEFAECREERLFNQRQYQKEKNESDSADYIRKEKLVNQHQYQNEKNAYSSTITDEIRKFHATVQRKKCKRKMYT